MDFDEAFEKLIGHEGGYVSPEQAARNKDPGGETKYGISKRAFPDIDIKSLTLDHAKVIYAQKYWGPAGCDSAPPILKFHLFDVSVNSGVTQAARTLQRAAGAEPDGQIGPRSIMAIQSMNPYQLVARFYGYHLEFLAGLKNWDANSEGWTRRNAKNLQQV